MDFLLLPATKLRQCNVFTSVCQEFCPQGGLCPSMHHRSHDWGSQSRAASVQGSLCPGESLSNGGLCPGVSVWGSLFRGVSVQGHLCPGGLCPVGLCPGGSLSRKVSVQEGLCPGGYLSRGSLLGRPPHRQGVTSGWYASYWNAFLLCIILVVTSN